MVEVQDIVKEVLVGLDNEEKIDIILYLYDEDRVKVKDFPERFNEENVRELTHLAIMKEKIKGNLEDNSVNVYELSGMGNDLAESILNFAERDALYSLE